MRRLTAIVALFVLPSCDNSTAPEIPAFVGEFCSTTAASVARSGPDATVTIPTNKTTFQDVRRSDGVVVRQEVRSCVQNACLFQGGASRTDADLTNSCRDLIGFG